MRRVYRRMTDNSPSRSRGVAIATAWALLAIIATGMLMEKHLTAIEPAGTYHEVEAQVKANEDWTVTHIFSAECPCSARTIEGVLHQEDIPGVTSATSFLIRPTNGPNASAQQAKSYKL